MVDQPQTTVYFTPPVIDAIDDRRHSTTSRSEWVYSAALARFKAELDGTWDDIKVEDKEQFVEEHILPFLEVAADGGDPDE